VSPRDGSTKIVQRCSLLSAAASRPPERTDAPVGEKGADDEIDVSTIRAARTMTTRCAEPGADGSNGCGADALRTLCPESAPRGGFTAVANGITTIRATTTVTQRRTLRRTDGRRTNDETRELRTN
jgi:hypothetical protein